MNHNELIKLTKEELVNKVSDLTAELNNLKHLGSTLEKREQQMQEMEKGIQEKVKDATDHFQKALQRREKELGTVIDNHGALLKVLQGTIDSAISLNAFMYQEITKK